MLLLSLAVAAAGVIVSMRTGNTNFFLGCSIPAAMVRKDLLPGEDRLLLTGGEQTITAEVLGVTRNLRTAGEKTSYYIVCRYMVPRTGRTETYTSRSLDEYPGKEVIGRKVTVRVDPGEKGKYTVDIDALFEEIEKEKRENEQADGMH